ncbi:MAG: D-tyrosyl-tRNA(Tyr) deacylase [Leptospiraceae bacterium]|nr:D-tyrosyl-tRNA(Tyr) deacylase [Leptospiraceae bacterium]MCP5496160.1 D-tyrosyl-tRNA(Tyr) deacylase [Leptospiraceae bacterium]
MRILLQRVSSANVKVQGKIVGQIHRGILLFVGITHTDTNKEVEFLAEKCLHLRIFENENGKMNHSVLDTKGEILVVSQFTLYGDTAKGRRPGFDMAAKPEIAEKYIQSFTEKLKESGLNIQTGKFRENMQVELVNDGPVTFQLEK